MSLVFRCRENLRRLEIFRFPNCPRFCRLMKTRNRRYPRLSGKDGDKSGKSGTLLFSRRVPDFSHGLRWISPITNPLNCWAPVSLSFVIDHLCTNIRKIWDRLLAIIRYIGTEWGMVGKSKIPARLGPRS